MALFMLQAAAVGVVVAVAVVFFFHALFLPRICSARAHVVLSHNLSAKRREFVLNPYFEQPYAFSIRIAYTVFHRISKATFQNPECHIEKKERERKKEREDEAKKL